MNYFYLDASALVKRYAPEPGTPLVDYLFTQVDHSRFALLNIGIAEVVSVLVRKRNSNLISAATYGQAFLAFGIETIHAQGLPKLGIEDATIIAALALIDRHHINSTDGVILQSVLQLADQLRGNGDDVVLVSCDLRLLRAARLEGVAGFDPEHDDLAALVAFI